MACINKKKDKYAYFYGEDLDDSLSESDDDNMEGNGTDKSFSEKNLDFITKSDSTEKGKNQQVKIPSAKEVLDSKNGPLKIPEFLQNKQADDIDWEKLAHDHTVEEEEVDLSNTNAIPPPKTYESQTDALKPTLGDNSDNFKAGDSKKQESVKRSYSESGDGQDEIERKKASLE